MGARGHCSGKAARMNAPVRRRHVFVWSAVFGYGSLAFTLARNVLLVPVYLNHIALAEYGAWLATGGALAQLLVADFGLSGVLTQRVASQSGAGAAGLRSLMGAGLANSLALALALGAASSLIAAWLPATQGLDAAQRARVMDCFFIAVGANSLGVLSLAGIAALRGGQKPGLAGAVMLGADILSVTVTLVCLFARLGLYAIALGLLVRSACVALGSLSSVLLTWRGALRDWRPNWLDSLAMWRDTARFFVTSIAMRLQSQANILFVGMLLGPHWAAVYGLTVRAHETVHMFMGQLNASFGPVLAHLAGAGQGARLDAVIRSLLPLVAALAAVGAVGVLVLNQSFVTLWAGPEAFGGAALTLTMALALWVTQLSFVGYEALLARGDFAYIARVFAIGSVVHVITVLTALEWLGVWAAPLALLCSSLSWGWLAWRRVAVQMRAAGAGPGAALGEAGVIGLAGAICGALLLAFLPPATSWSMLAAEAVMTALLVAAVLLIVRPGLRRTLRDEILSTLRAMRAA